MTTKAQSRLRVIRGGRRDGDGRQSVDFYQHGRDHVRSVVWTFPQLYGAIRRRRPRGPGDPDWTFSIGRRHSLTITTEGPGKFRVVHAHRASGRVLSQTTAVTGLALD